MKTAECSDMPIRAILRMPCLAALLLVSALLAACGGGPTKGDIVQAANIPTSFDVTIYSAKDNQFDYDGAPLTEEDLKSALRYRKEQNLPVATVLMKRGESQKIKNEHIISLARISYQMSIKTYMQDKQGEISEIRAQLKDADDQPKPKPQADK
jgi:hypothetical protein